MNHHPDDGRKVALYTRVSTGHQVDKESLPYQRQALTAYCEHVLHLPADRLEVYEDAGRSGKNTDRPAYQRLMKDIRSDQISHVVVYKIDRINRNLVDFSVMYETLKNHRVVFISMNEQFDTSSAMGEAMLKIILVFAELERKITSERVTDIMLDRARAGRWNGARVPYGWQWDAEAKIPVPDDTEAAILQQMYDMYDETHSTVKITQYLNSHGITVKRGAGKWTTKTVADVLRNPINKGDYRYNYRESAHGKKKPEDEVIYLEGVFYELISREQWDRVNAQMNLNGEARRKAGHQSTGQLVHVFSHKLICGDCGRHYQVQKRDTMRKNGFHPSIYICGGRHRYMGCNAQSISDVILGPFIFNYIANIIRVTERRVRAGSVQELEAALLNGPEFSGIAGIDSEGLQDMFSLICSRASGRSTYSPKYTAGPAQADIRPAREEIEKCRRALERLNKAYLYSDDGMSEREYLDMKNQIEKRRVDAENKIKAASAPETASSEAFLASASSFLLAHKLRTSSHIDYSEFAPTVTHEILRDFVDLVIDNITVSDSRVASIKFKNGITHTFLYKEKKRPQLPS